MGDILVVVCSIAPWEQFGGNIDLKHLTAGSTLYLPVNVAGGLFSVGDGHAVQGDGEVCVTGLEASLIGNFRLTVRKDLGANRAEGGRQPGRPPWVPPGALRMPQVRPGPAKTASLHSIFHLGKSLVLDCVCPTYRLELSRHEVQQWRVSQLPATNVVHHVLGTHTSLRAEGPAPASGTPMMAYPAALPLYRALLALLLLN